EQVAIHPRTEIRLVVTTALHQRARRQRQDETRLRRSARRQTFVVTPRLRRSVVADPVAVIAPQRIEVVVPVRAQGQRVADEGTQQGALDAAFLRNGGWGLWHVGEPAVRNRRTSYARLPHSPRK